MTLVVKTGIALFESLKCVAGRAVILSLVFWLAACQDREGRDHLMLEGATMGTWYHITIVADEGETLSVDRDELQAEIDARLEQINQQMSTYIEDSELMRFNRVPVGEWRELSQPLAEVLRISRRISEKSGGAFDITIAPLVDLWGFGPQGEPEVVPSDNEIRSVRDIMGYRQLELAEDDRARRLADIHVDLSAVAKGYGVDVLMAFLRRQGHTNALVEIGGELRVSGSSPRGDAWRLAIEQPSLLRSGARQTLALTDIAMATSGDYRNYYERDGQRYSHTIDPQTGYPIDHSLASVTVLMEIAAEADAWATALNVLGPERGLELAEREQLAVYMILKTDEGFVNRHSAAFESYLTPEK